ncbi:hypothetical protein [Cohaesibacter intestini]|uniref:hypothetical protein n=1 Tax=Cohaesibacter intestini TaxID=2211145 RepID=UPI000DE8F3A6|nr:hypothetical protein [Cohaesibacter intestini]
MFRSLSRSAVSILLWLLLVCLLVSLGYVALKACGIRIFGVEIAWCSRDPLPNVARINELYRQVQSLERLKAEPDFCPPASFRAAPMDTHSVVVPPVAGSTSPSVAVPQALAPVAPGTLKAAPAPTRPLDAQSAGPGSAPAVTPGATSPDTAPPSSTMPGIAKGEADPTSPELDPSKADNATADPKAKGPGMPLPKPAPLNGAPLDPEASAPGAATPPAAPGTPGAGNPPPGSPPTTPPASPPASPNGTPPPAGTPPATAQKPNGNNPCPEGKRTNPYIVLALDHSRSMALPQDMDDALATRLEGLMEKGGSAGWNARRLYNSYVEQNGRKRLDVLKDSVAALSQKIDPQIEFGVVSFAGCEGVVDMGNYDASRRARLVDKVRALEAKPATPAAIALKTAMSKAAQKPGGRVIFVSDGKDTCDADPCAVAKAQTGVRVDVISMGGGDVLACVAQATSGNIYQAGSNGSLEDLLLALGNQQGAQACR